ncbi:penicillin-binding protein 2 [Aciduricibacillus chroicocephali]|uniref:serine-type D-Ala-D-Ala carboxypeptidase n=1 Tax=Aciduricibacillus chroicocephali TaxID=3054939 RepID=A0ABY9KRY4_9BACI|nr:penicillin-binding protein 2 [Bacillaceae bacterium 44XB]
MEKKKKRPQLPFRLNLVFVVVFLLFSVLIVQLGVVQILKGQEYQDEIDRTVQETTAIPVPRGKIFDRNHKVVVDNKALYSITYTPPKGVQAEDKLEVAEKLAKYISMDKKAIEGLTERNKKEYWYLKHRDEADKRISQAESKDLSNADLYNKTLDRITEEEISGFTDKELKVMAIKKEMDKGYALSQQIVKNENVTPEEYAQVAEHLSELPGVNATTDWDRVYPNKDTFKSMLGTITTQDQGIPAEKAAYYLTRGYSRNDRVGKTGLEEQYEGLLRGRKEQIQYTTSKSGAIIDSETIVPGERGKDLILSIDMDLQKKVDKVVREKMSHVLGGAPYMNDVTAVVMKPKTGEVLAISGQHYDRKKGEFENASYKALYDANRPGSIVKGATVLAGFQSGVTSPSQYFYDAPIKIAGTPSKSSWKNMGSINYHTALAQSSNVYMFYVALRMGGEYGNPTGRSAKFNPEAFQEMRNYFSQFGLGTNTGIDFPYESTGYKGTKKTAGLLMDFAIGQYDTFTTMQLAQYVSTIANDGYRVKPHLLKEVREPSEENSEESPLFKTVDTQVLNRIQMDEQYIKDVQGGFKAAYQASNGTASGTFANKSYNPAGKTGTAQNEVYEDGKMLAETENLSLIGYAPFDDPEVSFALLVPNMPKNSGSHVNYEIGEGILDAYFDKKKKNNEEESVVEQ